MTSLAPIHLDRGNAYRLERGITEWFMGSCTLCPWHGPVRPTVRAAADDLAQHVEAQDNHPTLQPPKENSWLDL